METLTGDRVCLRSVALTDTDAVFAIWSDPEAMRYWSHPPYTERAQAEAKLTGDLEALAAGSVLPWAITLVGDNTLIGMFTIHQVDLNNGRAAVGYLLGRAHWGQGLATEAASLAIGYAFTTLGLRRLEADIDPRNEGSRKLLERLGFERDGYLRERWCVAGEVSDSALYGLLAREWSIK
jgi:[ribosomal protein S5]-alanine N-acetyltransferase